MSDGGDEEIRMDERSIFVLEESTYFPDVLQRARKQFRVKSKRAEVFLRVSQPGRYAVIVSAEGKQPDSGENFIYINAKDFT